MKIITHTCLVVFACLTLRLSAQQEDVAFHNYQKGFNKDVLALQVLLDRQDLSCNMVDGFWGKRTQIALMTWQTLHAQPVTGIPTAETLNLLGSGATNIFTRYSVTTNDLAELGPFPEDWEERAKLPGMKYVTILEMLSERCHGSEKLITFLNGSVKWPNPPAGTEIILPDCTPATAKKYAGAIRISLSRMEVTVFGLTNNLIALFPCSIARDKAKRPVGQLEIKHLVANPTYTYDPQLFHPGGPHTSKRIIPPGPNNPVGLAWMTLALQVEQDKPLQGYGLHGTPFPDRIGNAESKGCFRLANWNAQKLLRMASEGTPIEIED
jgi:L,D-transpeptidase catalytic domain/Putative peptidoglycan binding domain